jgi:hypothetical protein
MSLAMTREEREAFLAGVHVGVVSVDDPGRGPLTAPVWYAYEDGEVVFVIGRDSRKGRLMAPGTRVSLCAQTETPPYRYVSVEGPIAVGAPDFERHRRGSGLPVPRAAGWGAVPCDGGGNRGGESEVLVRLRPERWLTVDYGRCSGRTCQRPRAPPAAVMRAQ